MSFYDLLELQIHKIFFLDVFLSGNVLELILVTLPFTFVILAKCFYCRLSWYFFLNGLIAKAVFLRHQSRLFQFFPSTDSTCLSHSIFNTFQTTLRSLEVFSAVGSHHEAIEQVGLFLFVFDFFLVPASILFLCWLFCIFCLCFSFRRIQTRFRSSFTAFTCNRDAIKACIWDCIQALYSRVFSSCCDIWFYSIQTFLCKARKHFFFFGACFSADSTFRFTILAYSVSC